MLNKFVIGEIVYIPAKVEEISIKKTGVTYKVSLQTESGSCTDWFTEEQIAGDLVLGTIKTGEVHNATP